MKSRALITTLLLSLPALLLGQLPYAGELANGDFSEGIGEDLMPVGWYIQKDSTDNVFAGTQIVVNEGETPLEGSSTYVSLVKEEEAMKIALASPAIPEPGYGAVEVSFYARSAEEAQLLLNLLPEPWPSKLNYSSTAFNLSPEWQQYTDVQALPLGNHEEMRWFLDFIHDTDLGSIDITGIEVRFLVSYPSAKLENGDFMNGTTVGGLPVDWYLQEDTTEEVEFWDHIYVSAGETPNPDVSNYLTIEAPEEASILTIGSTAFPVPPEEQVDLQFHARASGINIQVRLYEFAMEGITLLDQTEVTPGANWTEAQVILQADSASTTESNVYVAFSVTGTTDPVDIAGVTILNQQQSGSTVPLPLIDPVLQRDWPRIDETAFNKYWAMRMAMPDMSESIAQASDFSTVYYIDPSANESGDGLSPETPFASWTEVTFQEDTAYLQKCGSSEVLETRLVTRSNVLIGAYGEGPRPVIECIEAIGNDHATIEAGPNNVTIRDLHLKAPNTDACIKMGDANMTLYNNVLEDCIWGIRGYGDNYRIYANIIHNVGDDGMYLKNASDLDIGWNYVFHINTKWIDPYTPQDAAGGDCVQLSTCTNWHVHHNVLDRTTSGNKFTFISNDGSGTCVVEYNYCAGPLSTGDGGAGIYFGNTHAQVDVRYNHIDRTLTGIYTNAQILNVYGNLITNSISGIYRASGSVSDTIQNNVFYNIEKSIIQKGDAVINNIIDNRKGKINLVQYTSALKNNLFMGTKYGDSSNISADPGFVDPERFNFRLAPGSPAIDVGAGSDLEADMDGVPIPQGWGPDIGAYEFTGGTGISWTVVYSSADSGWALTPHGYVEDTFFPYIRRRPANSEAIDTETWFFIHESSISNDGFFAYDYSLQSWIWVSLPFSPWIYVYAVNPDWQKWD